jgi:hypothetical protein
MDMQLEVFNYVIKNQLSFNELIKTKVTQLVSSCRNHNTGEHPEQPGVNPKENGNVVTVWARQSAQKLPLLQDVGTRRETVTIRNIDAEDGVLEEAKESNTIATQEDPVNPLELHGTVTIQLPYRF